MSKRLRLFLLVLPAVALLTFFFVFPIMNAVYYSFFKYDPYTIISKELTIENYVRPFTDPFYIAAFFTSLRISGLAAIFSLILGYPVAYLLYVLRKSWAKTLVILLVLSPLLISLTIISYIWLILFSRYGFVNSILMAFGLIQSPLPLMNSEASVIVGLIYYGIPFMILTLHTSLESVEKSITLAAKNLGATALRAFITITLPLTLPGIISGSLFVFSLSISAFVIPFMLGGRLVKTWPIMVYDNVMIVFDWSSGAALAVWLLVIALLIMSICTYVLEKGKLKWLR